MGAQNDKMAVEDEKAKEDKTDLGRSLNLDDFQLLDASKEDSLNKSNNLNKTLRLLNTYQPSNNVENNQGYVKITFNITNDPRLPSFKQCFNRRWTADNLQAVYLCYTPSGAALALDDAVLNYKLSVRIKSGGHCFEDFVMSKETLAILDVSPMTHYGKDDSKGYFVGSGATNWSSFVSLFRDYGVILPGGTCYSVGLGGHICGGGFGLLSRLNGLTVDWLTGVEVVVKPYASLPAFPIYVSADSTNKDEKDLFWAHCGGGGGNFGVITKYYFKTLPTSPAGALITGVYYSWDGLTVQKLYDILYEYAEFSKRTDNWRQFGMFGLNHSVSGGIYCALQTAVLEGEDQQQIHQDFVEPVLQRLGQIHPFELMPKPGVAEMMHFWPREKPTNYYTYYEAVQTMNPNGPNQRAKQKSAYMNKAFPMDQVEAIYKWLHYIPPGLEAGDMSQCFLQVNTYGGKINELKPTDTAIDQRSAILKLQFQSYWTDPSKDEKTLGWLRGFYEDIYKKFGGVPDPTKDPTGTVGGCYYNYPDVDLNGPSNDKHRRPQSPSRSSASHRSDPMAPTSKLSMGIKRASRSHAYHRRGLWAIKAKHGGAFPKAEKPAAAAEPKFYPADDVKPRVPSTRKPKPTKLRSSITPGTVLILLAGRFMGKRVVFLKQLKSGLLLVSGPFKINGVPIRRVNQTYVIATSTKVDISGVDVAKFDDKYFAREKKQKAKKTEGELFETEKETSKSLPDFKKDDQKAVDAALIKAIEAVPELKTYLGARFSLRDGDKPHEMVF